MVTRSFPFKVLVSSLVGAVTSVATAGCSSAPSHTGAGQGMAPTSSSTRPSAASAVGVDGRIGDISVSGAYIPQPASPEVAVAYFSVRNTGSRADMLVSASTSPVSQAMFMTETETSGHAGSMVGLPHGIPVPAHGTVTLRPGGPHLMLTDPRARLVEGDHVTVTLRLAHTGTLRLTVPVTSLLSDADTGSATAPSRPSSSMSSMPGM